jgi:hypothetical protein
LPFENSLLVVAYVLIPVFEMFGAVAMPERVGPLALVDIFAITVSCSENTIAFKVIIHEVASIILTDYPSLIALMLQLPSSESMPHALIPDPLIHLSGLAPLPPPFPRGPALLILAHIDISVLEPLIPFTFSPVLHPKALVHPAAAVHDNTEPMSQLLPSEHANFSSENCVGELKELSTSSLVFFLKLLDA